jgi:Golgi phosphoprotein 3 (GPP34)
VTAAVRSARLSGTGRLADDLYLIAHNDRTGRPLLQPRAIGLGLAGALLAELTLQHRISVLPGAIVVTDSAAPPDELAQSILRQLLKEHEQHPTPSWLQFLAQTAAVNVAHRLEHAGYLTQVRAQRLRRGERWAPVDADCAIMPFSRIQSALGSPGRATAGEVTLAGLAVACGLNSRLSEFLAPGARHYLDAAIGRLDPGLREVIAQTQAAVDSALLAHRV